ncbi:MAG: sensor histidine kinase [Vulcanimicrobiaceae bacterium]
MIGALSVGAYAFIARSTFESLRPIMELADGRAAYAAAMHRTVVALLLIDLPIALVVGVAAWTLASISVRPLLEARRREERFAADAAHELRTPLASIAATAQAARDSDPPAQAHALDQIATRAIDASRLVGDLLLLMREQRAGDPRLREPVDIVRLVRHTFESLRPPASAIEVRIEGVADAYVIGDERRLQILLLNLAQNALRHARGLVVARVRAEPASVVIEIEDDGAGVPVEHRERIFERFYKIRPDSDGSGLGLAIARHIARAHGGELQHGGGSRFVTRLPRATV